MATIETKTGQEIDHGLIWEKVEDADLRPNTYIAHPVVAPEQELIGTRNSIILIESAMEYLDYLFRERRRDFIRSLPPEERSQHYDDYSMHPHRKMNVLVTCKWDFDKQKYVLFEDGLPFNEELLKRTRIGRSIELKYNLTKPEDLMIGIQREVEPPVFYTDDPTFVTTDESMVISQAGAINHETIHLSQPGLGTPSSWGERQAISGQAGVIEAFTLGKPLSSGPLIKVTPQTTKEMMNRAQRELKNLSRYIEDFRQGGNGHVDPTYLDKTFTHPSHTPADDYVYR